LRKIHLASLLILLALVLSTAASGAITLNRGFENGALVPNWDALHTCAGNASTATNGRARTGTYSGKFIVTPGCQFGSSSGERAEVMAGQSDIGGYEGDTHCYSWSTFFPTNSFPTVPNSGWNIFAQFHNTGATGQANIQFRILNTAGVEEFQVYIAGGDPAAPTERYYTGTVDGFPSFARGDWYDFTACIHWAEDSTAYTKIYVDDFTNLGVIVNETGPNLYTDQGTYFKLGYYRDNYTATATLFQDRFRVADTRSEANADI